jgi:hypothetical protein
MAAGMARNFVLALVLMMCGGAQAAAPEFDIEHFCADFAGSHANGGMGDMAKAVCLLSERFWPKADIDGQNLLCRTMRPLLPGGASRVSPEVATDIKNC